METVQAALSKGMKVCCGGLFGLGESWADRKTPVKEKMHLFKFF